MVYFDGELVNVFGDTSKSTVNFYIKDESVRVMSTGLNSVTSGLNSLTSGDTRVTSGRVAVLASESSADGGGNLAAKLGAVFGVILGLGSLLAVALVVYARKRGKNLGNDIELEFAHKQFTLGNILGKGNFGEVYEGYYKGTGYALKRLKSEMVKDFESEKSILE